jgi:cytochrome P450
MDFKETPALTAPPEHVPPELIYDVDIFDLPEAGIGVHEAWKKLQTEAPRVFWTPRNGGVWMAVRAKEILEIQNDADSYSMRGSLVPNNPRPYPAPPMDFDPPEHAGWRILISPAFSPKVVADVETMVRKTTIELIEGFKPRGECEFVTEFTKVLPIVVFLTMMNLPLEDREILLGPADIIAKSPFPTKIHEARVALKNYVEKMAEERTANPQDDLFTRLLNAKVRGETIDRRNAVGMLTLLLSGGLDTVKNLLGFCAKFLASHPDHVKQLVQNPDLIPHAAEELMRRHGISNTARLVTRDVMLAGVQLKKGDQIQQFSSLVGLDDDTVPDPMTVDFSRPAPIPHATFGNGPHRCPGSILAKRELLVFLQEWLARIPEFRIKPGTMPQQGTGMVNNVSELWLSWDAG